METKKQNKRTISKFFEQVLLSSSTTSSKRFVTLMMVFHLFVASFFILFILGYMAFYVPKGRVDPLVTGLLKQVLEYDFYVILSGLGFITVENVAAVMVEKAKAKSNRFTSFSLPTDYYKPEEISDETGEPLRDT